MRPAVILLACLPLLSCSDGADSLAGGSGTGAGNALTVTALDLDGSVVAGAQVELRPAGQIPPPEGSAPMFSGTTTSDGRITFATDTGTWSVQVRHGGRAFHRVAREGEVADTLRPMSILTGFLKPAAGGRVALPGLGRSAPCDSAGFFRLDSLPSGNLDWIAFEASGIPLSGTSRLVPGQTTVPNTSNSPIAVDTLLRALPPATGFDRGLLGDTGAFALVLQARRTDTLSDAWFLAWTSGTGRGVRVGLAAPDTLKLEVDSTTYQAPGYRLGAVPTLVGLRWTATGWEVWIDGIQAIRSSMVSGTDRKPWTSPVLGPQGVHSIDWLATRKGLVPDAWFRQSLP